MPEVVGIHHITAMAGHPQQNLDFYTGVLGLRLVKVTVDFDDSETYHFYYSDGLGQPGTLLTFFPWQRALPGRAGVSQVAIISLAIPQHSLGYWMHRLMEKGIGYEGPHHREVPGNNGPEEVRVLAFKDPDGLSLELVAVPSTPAVRCWAGAPVPEESAIRGIFSAQIWVAQAEPSLQMLEALGYRRLGQVATINYLGLPQESNLLGRLEVREVGGLMAGRGGVGTVHHIGLGVPDVQNQHGIRELLRRKGVRVTPDQDRPYFRSFYFREPGGVLLEVATHTPGFTLDEPFESLGTGLRLPEWLEPARSEILSKLPSIHYASPLPVRSDLEEATDALISGNQVTFSADSNHPDALK